MKTAIEMMIKKWESELGSYIPNAPIYKAFIEEAKTYLATEKQQIIEAYNKGYLESKGLWGDEYYTSTFSTTKKL